MSIKRDFIPQPLHNCRLVTIVSRFVAGPEDNIDNLLNEIAPPVEEDIEMYLSVPEGCKLPELNLTHTRNNNNWDILRQVPEGTLISDGLWVSIEHFLNPDAPRVDG